MTLVQAVRLLDVFWLGPSLLAVAANPALDDATRRLLYWAGLGTIAFNGIRFLQEARD